ncbi:MAG: hypothetical protein ACHREM_14560 [Polyangiales bacterium]
MTKHLDRYKRPTVTPVAIKLVRLSPRRLDDDNSIAALKAVRDAVSVWVGVDDGDVRAVSWTYAQGRARTVGVRIIVTAPATAVPRVPSKRRKPRPNATPTPKPTKRQHPIAGRVTTKKIDEQNRRRCRDELMDWLNDTMEERDGVTVRRMRLFAMNHKTTSGAVLVSLPRASADVARELATKLVAVEKVSPVPKWNGEIDYVSIHTRFVRNMSGMRTQGVAISRCEAAPIARALLRFALNFVDVSDADEARLNAQIDDLIEAVEAVVASTRPLPSPSSESVAPLGPIMVPGGYVDRATGRPCDREGRLLDRDDYGARRSHGTRDDDEHDDEADQ